MASTETLLSWTTKYSADSVEWCPIEEYHNIFVCGTYQLLKEEEDTKADSEDRKVDQKRLGELYLFHITSETTTLKPIQTLETSAILDQKWCDNTIDGAPHLAVANAAGFLQIYKLMKDDNFHLELVANYELDSEVKILALSLDWSTRNNPTETPKIVVSDSKGNVTVCSFGSGGKITKDTSWNAHDYEAWICAFNCWETSLVITGGDDCTMKAFDLRCENSVRRTNRTHQAGVTSLHFNNKVENLFASGSYDENLRLWDSRKLNNPLSEEPLGGGVWRLKWDPFQQDILLAACMYGGFRIVDCKNSFTPKVIAEYNEHQSIAYGSDWCYDRSLFKDDCGEEKFHAVISTCSFYDCKLDVVKIKY